MESYIKLSTLNDFIFCPKSIYYHEIYDSYNPNLYHETAQKEWKIAHNSIDNKTYSTSKYFLQSLDVYSEQYWIHGKIDLYNIRTGELIERKNQIHRDEEWKEKIYTGYKYQLWWQMFCLLEMWYQVESLWFYSVKDNKKYRIYKPSTKELIQFENMLNNYKRFDLLAKNWKQNTQKCIKCIYRELCDYYIWEVYEQLKLFD
jgi:CRISPR-associated protein Cas4